jgi:hypothetical protein
MSIVISSEFPKIPFTYFDPVEDSDYKAVNETLKGWVIRIRGRLGKTRAHMSSNPGMLATHPEIQENFIKDLKAVDQYKFIVDALKGGCTDYISKKKPFFVRALRSAETVQSVASYHLYLAENSTMKEQSLYVGSLATAPWNLRFDSPTSAVDEDEAVLVRPGAGATMLLSLIQKAFFEKCQYLYLKPLDGSFGFYERMGMTHVKESDIFYLDLRLKIPAVFFKYVDFFRTPLAPMEISHQAATAAAGGAGSALVTLAGGGGSKTVSCSKTATLATTSSATPLSTGAEVKENSLE